MGTPKDSEVTRGKIIEAAGQLFAEKGFKAVTVREIVQLADTHLSALNYHFKGKEALYLAVVEEACRAVASTKSDQQALLAMPAEDALYYYVKGALDEYSESSELNWQYALVSRNSVVPDELSSDLILQHVKVELSFVAQLLGKAINEEPTSDRVLFSVCSLMGLLDTVCLYGVAASSIAPSFAACMQKNDWVAKQVVTLVLAGAGKMPV